MGGQKTVQDLHVICTAIFFNYLLLKWFFQIFGHLCIVSDWELEKIILKLNRLKNTAVSIKIINHNKRSLNL